MAMLNNQRVHCSHVSSTWESRRRSQHPNLRQCKLALKNQLNWENLGWNMMHIFTGLIKFNPWIPVYIYIWYDMSMFDLIHTGFIIDFFLFKLGQVPMFVASCPLKTWIRSPWTAESWSGAIAIFIISKFSVGFIIIIFFIIIIIIIMLLFFFFFFFFFFFCFARWCALASCIPLGAFEHDPRPWLTHAWKPTVRRWWRSNTIFARVGVKKK